jgi:hypothetical protein
MADATMSREELAAFLAAIKKLRDELDVMRAYVTRAASKTEESLKDIKASVTEVAPRK